MSLKKIFAQTMALAFCCSATFYLPACELLDRLNPKPDSSPEKQAEQVLNHDKYDLDLYMKPLWQGSIVYNETLAFVGKEDSAPLLYPATELISVRSYDLKTEYVEGVDYTYDKQTNRISLHTNTSIPYFTESEFYPETAIEGSTFNCTLPDHNYILFGEGSTFCSRQIAVTYRHSEEKYIPTPPSSSAFSKTLKKLEDNKDTTILFYGDSVTVGANASGFINYGPYADSWTKMVFNSLVDKYGCTNATYVNTAVGGWTTQDGINALQTSVIAHAPDAVFLAFGLNDVTLTPTQHTQNMKTMVDAILNALPDTDICLITPMLTNKDVYGFFNQQENFQDEYYALVYDYKNAGNDGICLANVTEMHQYLLQTKRYYDMTGNNVNHPNDFVSRLYAQTVFKTVCGD